MTVALNVSDIRLAIEGPGFTAFRIAQDAKLPDGSDISDPSVEEPALNFGRDRAEVLLLRAGIVIRNEPLFSSTPRYMEVWNLEAFSEFVTRVVAGYSLGDAQIFFSLVRRFLIRPLINFYRHERMFLPNLEAVFRTVADGAQQHGLLITKGIMDQAIHTLRQGWLGAFLLEAEIREDLQQGSDRLAQGIVVGGDTTLDTVYGRLRSYLDDLRRLKGDVHTRDLFETHQGSFLEVLELAINYASAVSPDMSLTPTELVGVLQMARSELLAM